ncbi:MAG: alpha/beta fold hydrolase [Phascolarctobacterium sp.]|nr:alpha/beta fold hydrolase [Phascolarctobacterium sp.]
MKVIKGAEEFMLQGTTDKGVLLIHGYTGTPAEMRLLGDHMHQQGYTVLGVRLPGHGTKPEDLNETEWQHWYAAAEEGFLRLQERCSEVMVAGLSMGGLLAIKVAAELPVSKAAILAAPIYVQDKRAPFLHFLSFFIKYLKKRKRNYFVAEKYNLAYDVMPVKPLGSLFALVDLCKKKLLEKITVPCIVLQSTIEHTVNPKSAQYIYDKISSSEKKLVWYKNSGHILTLDVEREKVFEEISKFFEE